MKLVLVAGGKGTRLGLQDCPKAMVEVEGMPLVAHHIQFAAANNMDEVILLCGYQHEIIEDFVAKNHFALPVRCLVEDTPLGTAGAVAQLKGHIDGRFLVIYADVFADFDLSRMLAFDSSAGGIGTLLVHPNDHPYDSDLVECDAVSKKITAFFSKPHDVAPGYRNIVSAAIYILSEAIFDYIPAGTFSDFGKDIFPALVRRGCDLYAYQTSEYVKDLGTPARLEEVRKAVRSGFARKRNLGNKQRAIFLDRDGVINEERGTIRRPEDFTLLSGAVEAIQLINKSEYLAIVVTNQPDLAKGFTTADILDETHKVMETALGKKGAYLDAVYFCPHHPESGFPGEVAELKVECLCRKPRPGMLVQAALDFNIDLRASYIIGDRFVDMLAGQACGAKAILVRTGFAGSDKKPGAPEPHTICADLLSAVKNVFGEKHDHHTNPI